MAACDDETKPEARIDLGESATFEDGDVGGGPVGGVFAADEVSVFSTDHDRSQDAFGLVVVDGEVATRGIDGESGPAVEQVAESLVHRAATVVSRQSVDTGRADTVEERPGIALSSL